MIIYIIYIIYNIYVYSNIGPSLEYGKDANICDEASFSTAQKTLHILTST
jgi:hypothetical protein